MPVCADEPKPTRAATARTGLVDSPAPAAQDSLVDAAARSSQEPRVPDLSATWRPTNPSARRQLADAAVNVARKPVGDNAAGAAR